MKMSTHKMIGGSCTFHTQFIIEHISRAYILKSADLTKEVFNNPVKTIISCLE